MQLSRGLSSYMAGRSVPDTRPFTPCGDARSVVSSSGEWRVGCKHVYGLVSRGLVSRLKEERKRKWEETQRGAIAEAVAALAKWVSFSGGKGKTQTMGPRAAGPRSSRGQEARWARCLRAREGPTGGQEEHRGSTNIM
mgnify:CR=1 FL=1